MKQRRVVITGIGLISPIGIGLDSYFINLKSGKSGIVNIENIMLLNNCPVKLGGRVFGFDPLAYMSQKAARRMDRFAQFSVAATKMAFDDAGIRLIKNEKIAENIGVFLGTAVGGFPYGEEQHKQYLQKGLRRVDPLLSSRVFYGCGSNQVCIELGLKGISNSITSGCAASLDAIGSAYELIKENKTDIFVCGGADAPFAPLTFSSFYLVGVMSTKLEHTPSPFDATRDGIVISEGAGILVLEEREHALSREARIYAEVVGYGTTHDAYHVTQPAPDGLQISRAINLALKDANIDESQIDHIVAHGCATKLSDKLETQILKKVFGEHIKNISISGIESMIGHPLGAVGVLKAISGILTLKHSTIFPTINYKISDPHCDLDYVINKSRQKKVLYVMVNAFSFGGKNSILIMKKHSDDN